MKTFAVFGIIALLSALAQSAPAEDDTVTEVPTAETISSLKGPQISKEDIQGSVTCYSNGTLAFTTEFKQKAHLCMDPDIWGTEEGKKNPNCKFFCQARGVGTLNDDGVPTKDLYASYIDLAFPEQVRTKVKEHVNECLTTLGGKIDPKDPDCEGAAEFNKCAFQVFAISC